MRSKLAYGFILAAAASCLAGCSYLRPTGPCFGTGCPARTVGQNGQYKMGQGPKTAGPDYSAGSRAERQRTNRNIRCTERGTSSQPASHAAPHRAQIRRQPPPSQAFPSSADGP